MSFFVSYILINSSFAPVFFVLKDCLLIWSEILTTFLWQHKSFHAENHNLIMEHKLQLLLKSLLCLQLIKDTTQTKIYNVCVQIDWQYYGQSYSSVLFKPISSPLNFINWHHKNWGCCIILQHIINQPFPCAGLKKKMAVQPSLPWWMDWSF